MYDKPVPLTKEGYDKLVAELDELRTTKRAESAERIKYALQFGDLTESTEYEDAKNAQGMVEGRIMMLENMIRNAVIIEGQHNGIVQIGSKLTIKDEFGTQDVTIVGAAEADPSSGKISSDSPVGKGLMGKGPGDEIEVPTPSGTRKVKVVKIL